MFLVIVTLTFQQFIILMFFPAEFSGLKTNMTIKILCVLNKQLNSHYHVLCSCHFDSGSFFPIFHGLVIFDISTIYHIDILYYSLLIILYNILSG